MRSGFAPAGFTLLELTVVLAIMGVVFVGITVLVADRDRPREAAERFHAVFGLARDRALLRGETLGLEVWRDGYGFRRLDEDWRWQPMAPGPLSERRLAAGLGLRLFLDGIAVVLGERAGRRPQITLLPTGETTAFELHVTGDGDRAVIRRDLLGRPVEGDGPDPREGA